MRNDIFISYSIEDKVIADAVVSALENEKIRCWVAPRDIEPGADWGDSITEAIHECKIVLLIFSSSANQSKRVLDEIYYAISEEKTILPFRIENLDPTGAMRLHLSSRHWLDAYHPSWQAHIDRLISSVAGSMGREMPLPAKQRMAPEPVLSVSKREKKKIPWSWIGLMVMLLVVLGVVGALWLDGSEGGGDVQPIALVEYTPPAATEAIALLEETTPTEAPSPSSTLQPEFTETPPVIEPEVVLNGYFVEAEEGISLDPQQFVNIDSVTFSENLFMGLTNYDREKQEIVPEAAVSWTISPDGKLYTFKLRTDIPWVVHTPGGETIQVLDEDGEPRFVSAQDFVDTFRRTCDPRVDSMNYWFLGMLKGCEEVSNVEDPENLTLEMLEGIGVRAIAENELLVELEIPSGYFLSLTSLQTLSAMPQWAIDKYGAAWTNPGILPTCGRFVIDAWTPGESIRWVRNPLLPEEMMGEGNVDVIEFALLENDEDAYALWLENELDYSTIPQEKLLNHRVSYAGETTQIFEQLIHFITFSDITSPPFNDIHLRRAFAAAFDRTAYINDVLEGQGLAMKHLAPPDVIGAPPIDQVGVGYNLEYAQAEMSAAGYPNCQSMTNVTIWLAPSRDNPGVSDVIRDWEKNLNCPDGTIIITTGSVERSDMKFGGWISDYPDEHDWVGTILACDVTNFSQRRCNEIDDLMTQAAQEVNLSKRIELYSQVEEAFFGEEGEFPLIPVSWAAFYTADHTWLDRTQYVMGREIFYNWIVDMEAKLEEMGQ